VRVVQVTVPPLVTVGLYVDQVVEVTVRPAPTMRLSSVFRGVGGGPVEVGVAGGVAGAEFEHAAAVDAASVEGVAGEDGAEGDVRG
jgi:hypothetical protein